MSLPGHFWIALLEGPKGPGRDIKINSNDTFCEQIHIFNTNGNFLGGPLDKFDLTSPPTNILPYTPLFTGGIRTCIAQIER